MKDLEATKVLSNQHMSLIISKTADLVILHSAVLNQLWLFVQLVQGNVWRLIIRVGDLFGYVVEQDVGRRQQG